MNIKPRGSRGILWLDVAAIDSPSGQRIRTSLGTTDMKVAQRKAKEIIEGTRQPGKDLTFGEACKRGRRDLWADVKAGDFFATSVTLLQDLIGESTPLHRVDEDTVAQVVAALRSRGNRPSTINRRLSVLSRLLRAAHREWRVLARVPYIPHLKEPRGRTRTYTEAEEDMILSWCRENHPELGRLAQFLFATGARVSEALNLDPKTDVLASPAVIFRDTKGGHPRTLPVSSTVAMLVRQGPLQFRDSNAVSKAWREMRDALGYTEDQEFVAHAVRHTVATRLLRGGWSLNAVKDWMGHATIQTTVKYTHLVESDLRGGEEILERPRPALKVVS